MNTQSIESTLVFTSMNLLKVWREFSSPIDMEHDSWPSLYKAFKDLVHKKFENVFVQENARFGTV